MNTLESLIQKWVTEIEDQQFLIGPQVSSTGVSVAVIKDAKISHLQGLGLSDRETGESVTPDTVFPIASITKSFTAAALITALRASRKGGPETRIRDLDPSFELSSEKVSREARFSDLLSHRTGLPRHDSLWARAEMAETEIFRRLKFLEMDPLDGSGFRQSFQYNNILYGYCGKTIELLTGIKWKNYIETSILKPLEMSQTWMEYDLIPQKIPQAKPYFRDLPTPILKRWTVPGAAAIFSTAENVARWLILQIGKGQWNGASVLPEDIFESTLWKAWNDAQGSPEVAGCFESSDYGLGWFLDKFLGRRCLHHGGSANGSSAFAAFMPDERVGVVVLANQTLSRLPRLLSKRLLGYLLEDGRPQNDRFAPTSLFSPDTLMPLFENSDLPLAPAPGVQWAESSLGNYVHPGYGEIRVVRNNEFLDFYYGLERWPAIAVSDTVAKARLPLIGMPCTILIQRTAESLELPFNLYPENREHGFHAS